MKLKNSSIWSAPYRERIPSLLQHSHYAPISNWYGKDDSYTVREKFLNTEFFSGPYLDTFHAVLGCNSYIFLLKLHLLLFSALTTYCFWLCAPRYQLNTACGLFHQVLVTFYCFSTCFDAAHFFFKVLFTDFRICTTIILPEIGNKKENTFDMLLICKNECLNVFIPQKLYQAIE